MNISSGPALLAPVIAHRGASGDAPENTLAALLMAADQGAVCAEIDVSISADNIAFVHHDDQLERCTNGTGLLCRQTASELDKLDASKGMPGFAGEPLPRLSAAIEALAMRKVGLNIEIKPYAGLEQQTVEAVAAEIEAGFPADLPLVLSSFSRKSLAAAQQRMPDIARALLVKSIPENWQALIDDYQCRNLHCAGNLLTLHQAAAVRDASVGLYCYTVNDIAKARQLLNWGVHGVFTDYPQRLLTGL